MKKIVLLSIVFISGYLQSQPLRYTTANAHSHNDYANKIPFFAAYGEGFGSIEADILLANGVLYVGHDTEDVRDNRTLEDFYLKPLLRNVQKNKGHVYADTAKPLQLMIDIKTDSISTLDSLISLLKRYPELIAAGHFTIAISGNKPSPSLFTKYPSFIGFDGNIEDDYTPEQLSKIVMLSSSLKNFTQWNGKGIPDSASAKRIQAAVAKAHALHKTVRFWEAPDYVNTWNQLMKFGVDYINTDHINELGTYLSNLKKTSFTNPQSYPLYKPSYKTDGDTKKAKNIILIIGDGTSLPQWYAGYTANHGALNVFGIKNIGLSTTSSYDNYVTDSAPGATSISSGTKTNNRFVGVDHTGAVLPLIPEIIAKRKMKTGIITCGDIADATPASFYAHQNGRDKAAEILHDLLDAPVDIVMGSGDESLNNVAILQQGDNAKFDNNSLQLLKQKFHFYSSLDDVTENASQKVLVVDKKAGLSMLNGRGPWLQEAFAKTTKLLAKNPEGFFLMLEGAQVDYGGHDNNLPYVATELMDLDKTIGDALRFADSNGETLVIVTGDHETGGLTLPDGDYTSGMIRGQFSTNDHTALPVPVFAYGPQSQTFCGVYENTELFHKILRAIGMQGNAK